MGRYSLNKFSKMPLLPSPGKQTAFLKQLKESLLVVEMPCFLNVPLHMINMPGLVGSDVNTTENSHVSSLSFSKLPQFNFS